jgi:hypothetical protein
LEFDVSQADSSLCLHDRSEDFTGVPLEVVTQVDAVQRIVIDAAEPVEYISFHQLYFLLFCMLSVTTKGEYDRDVLFSGSCQA